MKLCEQRGELIKRASISEFFKEQLERALQRRKLELYEATVFYLVNMLEEFSRADRLHEEDAKALATLFLESSQALPLHQRIRLLKRVGDVTLYMSGFFAESLNQKLVDLDYYISLGGSAYAHLTNMVGNPTNAEVYTELARKFCFLVELLMQIRNERLLTSNQDILEVYERWLKTRSKQLYSQLISHGILPCGDFSSESN